MDRRPDKSNATGIKVIQSQGHGAVKVAKSMTIFKVSPPHFCNEVEFRYGL